MIDNLNALLDIIERFLLGLGVPEFLVNIILFLLAGLVIGGLVVYIAHWLISKLLFWNNRRRLSRDLHPFYTKAEIDKATRYYIPTKYQDTASSQADEPSRSFIDSPKAKLIPMMLKTAFQQDDSRYYLILADSGMGKTTFMMNLFLAYKNQRPWKQKHGIRLLPLGHPQTLAEVEKITNPEHTILLLDALDEDVEAVKDYKKRLGKILDKTWKFREVVITCRTQFFPSDDEEPNKTGLELYGTEGGSILSVKFTFLLLLTRTSTATCASAFKFWQWKDRSKAKRIVLTSPNIMVRPMLLSHIKDLVSKEREYEYSFQIYEALTQKWAERESNKPGIGKKYGSKETYQKILLEFSHALAIDLYTNRNTNGEWMSFHMNRKIISISGLQINEIFETWSETDWRSRSLLVRSSNNFYNFSHKSILEFFLAKEAFNNNTFLKR
ncbi:MAG: PspC domain-containing protein [Saprospiraceae bacterium]|nr:PspC domain-containing protein [Saprospiraceae bacterium]